MPDPSSWPSVETDLKSQQMADLEAAPTLVLLGSSVTEAAVDPAMLEEITGLSLPYNSALPFSSPLSTEIWLNQVVLPTVAPELIVFGVPIWPSHGESEGALGRGIERAASPPTVVDVLGWSALVGKRGVLADWDRLIQRESLKSSGFWTELGHQTGYYDQSDGSLEGRFPPFGEPAMSPEQTDALERMILSSQQRGTNVVLLLEPGRFPDGAAEVDTVAYISWLEDRASEWGIEFWDTYSIEWEAAFFADEAHFNRRGTEAFTHYLAGLLNDHFATSD
jgi:hypothetical protein